MPERGATNARFPFNICEATDGKTSGETESIMLFIDIEKTYHI